MVMSVLGISVGTGLQRSMTEWIEGDPIGVEHESG